MPADIYNYRSGWIVVCDVIYKPKEFRIYLIHLE